MRLVHYSEAGLLVLTDTARLAKAVKTKSFQHAEIYKFHHSVIPYFGPLQLFPPRTIRAHFIGSRSAAAELIMPQFHNASRVVSFVWKL